MKFLTIVIGCILLIVGCTSNSTSYRSYSASGGYKDMKIDENRYIVEYHGNDETSSITVKELWHKRAIELCPQGYDILKESTFKNDKGIIVARMIHYATVYPMFKSAIQCK